VIDWEYQGLWSTHGIDATKAVYVQEGRLKVETVFPSPPRYVGCCLALACLVMKLENLVNHQNQQWGKIFKKAPPQIGPGLLLPYKDLLN
jgi:hypothetical protein